MSLRNLQKILEDVGESSNKVSYRVCRLVSGTHTFLRQSNTDYSFTDTIREAAPIDDPQALANALSAKWPDKQFELVDVEITMSGGEPLPPPGQVAQATPPSLPDVGASSSGNSEPPENSGSDV